jgi:thiol:disulfide interchange protein DsbD
MNVRVRILATMIILLGLPAGVAMVQGEEEPRVAVRLVADTGSVEPGSTFLLGVHLEIEDGWHVYWRYPGGAGLATEVDFDLPDGFVAGPLEWPLPIVFTQSEGIPGYGYEGSVVLATQVEVSPNVRPAQAMARAQVSWLACKGVCILGATELEGSLSGLAVDPVFRDWHRHLARRYDGEDAPFSMSTTGELADGAVTLWLQWRGSPQTVECFPDPSEALDVSAVQVQSRGGLTRIDAEIRQRKGATGSIDSLPSLLVVTDSSGARRGWNVSIELKNSAE